MEEIFEDFEKEVAKSDKCCALKDLRYNAGHVPDYSKSIIQQLYLLRFFPAYFLEYYIIYEHLISLKFLIYYNVLSVGSGCGLDYYGLHYALKKSVKEINKTICYTGVDIIDWRYRDKLENDELYFINEDICDWDKLDWGKYNIIIFPKSLSEFCNSDFAKIEKMLSNSVFEDDKICIVSSIREQFVDQDIDSLKRIIDIMEKSHGYKCKEKKTEYRYFKEDKGISKYIPGFCYPQYILDYITDLLSQCKVYIANDSDSCEYDCEESLGRWPILKSGRLKFQVVRLER